MMALFITGVIFLSAFVLQVLLVRVLCRLRVHLFASFITYIVGLLLMIYQALIYRELFYTSIFIYILMSALVVTFSFVPLLGQPSPSSVIMTMLSTKRFTYVEMEKAFNEKLMIRRRVEDLVKAGILVKHGKQYMISFLGGLLYRLISLVSTLMGLKIIG